MKKLNKTWANISEASLRKDCFVIHLKNLEIWENSEIYIAETHVYFTGDHEDNADSTDQQTHTEPVQQSADS